MTKKITSATARVLAVGLSLLAIRAEAETFKWQNVKIGGGGGFVPNIIYSPVQKGLVYARTDMGGLYRLDTTTKTWIPLTDWIKPSEWNMLGGESFATDPVDPKICYFAAGTYTNDWTTMNGRILRSTDYGDSWTQYEMPIKFGGNMPGRGMGERLAIDPHSTNVIYFGARSGNGLWKSTSSGQTWAKVGIFPVTGDYIQDSTYAYTADPLGVVWEAFDTTSSASGSPSARIFVGVAQKRGATVFVSEDAGKTWDSVANQPEYKGSCTADSCHIMPHHGVIANGYLYIPYNNKGGPYDGSYGEVWKYNIAAKTWTDISPHNREADEAWGTTTLQKETPYFGYSGIAVNPQNPAELITTVLNSYWPDFFIFRSTDTGKSWTKSFYWTSYPSANLKYTIEPIYPWLNWGHTKSEWPTAVFPKLGWMVSNIVFNPFDSNEVMYGTGATIYGTKNFGNWGDTTNKVAFKSVAEGIEECAVLALAVPPVTTGANADVKLITGVGDLGGFTHTDLQTSTQMFTGALAGHTTSIDYAELAPTNVIRVGTGTKSSDYDNVLSFSTSSTGGKTWSSMYLLDSTYKDGTVAMSAKGSTFLWAASGKAVKLVNASSYSATTVSDIPVGAHVASDRFDDITYYASYDSAFYYGSGSSYTANTKPGFASGTWPIKAVPGRQGQVWVPTGTHGLWLTKDGGKSFSLIDTTVVQQADIIGFGKAAPSQTYPALYITGKVSGVEGVFLSKDTGTTWVRVNDDAHQYGSINYAITGDMRTYGLVYVGTNGRGVVYGTIDTNATSTGIRTSSAVTDSRLMRSGTSLWVNGSESLKLYNMLGKLTNVSISNGQEAKMDISKLQRGVYLARWGHNSQLVPIQ